MDNKIFNKISGLFLFALLLISCTGTSTDEYLDGDFINNTGDKTPPSAILPVAGESVFSSKVVLQWTSKKKAAYYTVEISESKDADFSVQIEGSPFRVDAPDTMLAIDLPTASATYYWRVRADITSIGLYGQSSFESMDDTIYIYCPASVTTPDNTGMVGNKSKPFQTIMRGIAEANKLNLTKVKVAAREISAGNFLEYKEVIVLKDGINLYGGYIPDFSESERDIQTHKTVITGYNGLAVMAAGISLTTVFEGFSVGLQDDAITSYAVYADSNIINSFTIKDCEISGIISAIINTTSYAIFINNSSITVADSIISGGDLDPGGTSTYGVYIENGNPVIKNNNINGGKANSSYGIYINNGKPLIEDNEIEGGTADRSYGMYIDSGYPDVTRNSISGGISGIQSFGIKLVNGGGSDTRNNIIAGGMAGTTSYGICIDGASVLMINNLVRGGSSSTSCGLYNRLGSMDLYNNTIAGGNAITSSYGMDTDSPITSDTGGVSLHNNIIYTTDNTGTNHGISKTGVNNDYFYHSYNCYYGGTSGTHYEGFNLDGAEITVNPNLNTTTYHPQLGSPLDVRFGGNDYSSLYNNYNTDLDDIIRTAVSHGQSFGDGWSLGAYECDLILIPLP